MSIKEVAKRAGVSVGTVSHVLNGKATVATELRERVEKAIADTGYVRNASARQLRSASNTAIGIIVVDIANPFFTAVLRGAETEAVVNGFSPLLFNSDSLIDRENTHLRYLEEQRVRGLLMTPLNSEALRERLDRLRSRGTPVVLLNEPADRVDVCSASVDDVMGGEFAGHHLLSIGRSRIVYLTATSSFRPFEQRLAGLRRAVTNHERSKSVVVNVVAADTLEPPDVLSHIDEALAFQPDAIFCANDATALTVLQDLTQRGFRVPEDIAIVGYDDTAYAALSPVPLTSIRQPAYEVGRTAAQMLVEECLGGEHTHRHVVFNPELVVRESTVRSPKRVARKNDALKKSLPRKSTKN
jgi:LacI family transcriptional regulator